jgi:hypothetical protein
LASESILKATSAQFHDLIDAHLGTTFETCRAAAPHMVAQGGGSIINTSSFAFLGDYGGTGYPAGKGGINGLTLAIAAELKEHGVRANVVCPGAKTRLSTGPEYEAHIVELNRRGYWMGEAQAALTPRPVRATAPVRSLAAISLGRHGSDLHRRRRLREGRFDRLAVNFRLPRPSDSPPWSVDEINADDHPLKRVIHPATIVAILLRASLQQQPVAGAVVAKTTSRAATAATFTGQ